jgi:hypothetical protein
MQKKAGIAEGERFFKNGVIDIIEVVRPRSPPS